MIAAVHLYHLAAFYCTTEDYIRIILTFCLNVCLMFTFNGLSLSSDHFIFGGVIVPLGFWYQAGPVQNAIAMFICGLPGGLDYIMICLVKHGLMDPLLEKRYNARINVWMRSPGLIVTAYTVWVAAPAGSSIVK